MRFVLKPLKLLQYEVWEESLGLVDGYFSILALVNLWYNRVIKQAPNIQNYLFEVLVEFALIIPDGGGGVGAGVVGGDVCNFAIAGDLLVVGCLARRTLGTVGADGRG